MQRINRSVPLPPVPAESRCSSAVHEFQGEIIQGHHIPDESSSPHNPEHLDLFRDIYVLEPCVGFSQRQPISVPQLSKANSHQENPSQLGYEDKIASPIDSPFPDERSMCQAHKQHVASHTRNCSFTLILPNLQLVQQNCFPQRQNDSQDRSLLDSSDHQEGRIYQDYCLQREAVLIGEDEFVCSVCNLRLPSHANLQQHEEMHTSERSSAYNIYYRNLTANNELLQRNESRAHEKSLSCTECGKKFSSKYNLRQHKLTHTGERPYKCDFCVYASATKSDLKKHQRTHTGERPFKCEICGADFSQSYSLTIHRRTHTGERPFKCKFCDYEGAQSSTLKAHIRARHQTDESLSSETSMYSLTS